MPSSSDNALRISLPPTSCLTVKLSDTLPISGYFRFCASSTVALRDRRRSPIEQLVTAHYGSCRHDGESRNMPS